MHKTDTRMEAYDEKTRFGGIVYVLMLVVAVAFAGFIWNLYAGREAPHISAPAGAYKIAPPADGVSADAGETAPADGADEPDDAPVQVAAISSAPETPITAPAAGPIARPAAALAPAPGFVANGPFLAQVAALQSEAAVEPAWDRLASRAPQLFGQAHLDVERADLGQRGVYFRVRAGYFADRDNAHRFCQRIEQLGQDCIVVQR